METLTLQTETRELLNLVVHSLYSNREVFLRELVSNASDALDRYRFERLTRREFDADSEPLEIRLEVDAARRTLTIRDNGIGMSRDEVIGHVGTIARSGSREFATAVAASTEGRDSALDLIGRFGVGFYSSFMVADKVTVVTCRAGEETGTRWQSNGDVEYTVEDIAHAPRGTAVTLHLKAVDAETGVEDYVDRWVLARIIKRYADFIVYPVLYVNDGLPAEAPDSTNPSSRVVLNSMKPIWTRSQEEVTVEEYEDFYRHVAGDWNSPLQRLSFKAEGRSEYTALFFIPSHAPHDLYLHAASYGPQLYAQRVLIIESCPDLLPRYLRFIKGVVDAADLALNVSRNNLQHAHHLVSMRKWLTRRVLDALDKLRATELDKYLAFWREFGRALKEGISQDHDNVDRLTPLLLFESSNDPAVLTSLADYVARMKPGQPAILYASAESRAIAERLPHLEQCRERGYEVLYFVDPVDELLAQSLHEFQGKRLRPVTKGDLLLDEKALEGGDESETVDATVQPLLEAIKGALGTRIRAVTVSRRLTVSPACLSNLEVDLSPHIERLLRRNAGWNRRTLEINVSHPLVIRLRELHQRKPDDPYIGISAELLLGTALLSEGSELPSPADFSSHVIDVLTQTLTRPTVEILPAEPIL